MEITLFWSTVIYLDNQNYYLRYIFRLHVFIWLGTRKDNWTFI